MTDRKAEFIAKLRTLLEEYSVSIDAGYKGDTHGIDSEWITIMHRPDPQSFREVEWMRLDYQITLSAHDLKED